MLRDRNIPNRSYVVQALYPDGRAWEAFRIDQKVPAPGGPRELDRIDNQVQEHLNNLHRKTGFGYEVVYTGSPEMATAVMDADENCPF